jgi:hypothetical protein
MKNAFKAAIAAVTLGATVLAPSIAAAEPHGFRGGGYGGYHGGGGYRGGGYYRGGHGGVSVGTAVGAGILGLAVGSALGGYYGGGRYYDGYYGRPYYGGGYPAYYGGAATCYGRNWVWDPYLGRYIMARAPYPC